jgi:cephalosporin-C deacetylase
MKRSLPFLMWWRNWKICRAVGATATLELETRAKSLRVQTWRCFERMEAPSRYMNTNLVFALLASWLGAQTVFAQVRLSSLTGTPGYSQNFDGLPANSSATPPTQTPFAWTNNGSQSALGMTGWYIVTTVGSSNSVLAGPDAYVSSAGGDVTNVSAVAYGANLAGERALGFRMATAATENAHQHFYAGLVIHNDTGRELTAVTVSYLGEQWSKCGGGLATTSRMDFAYKNLGVNFNPATFALQNVTVLTDVNALDFTSTDDNGATDVYGDLGPVFSNAMSQTITFPSTAKIESGEYLLLLWTAVGNGIDSGAHALAIDDVGVAFTMDPSMTVGYNMQVTADRAVPIYGQNEEVAFTIKLTSDGLPVPPGTRIKWRLTKDGLDRSVMPNDPAPALTFITAYTSNALGELVVTGRLNEPGFLQCRADYTDVPGGAAGRATAAIGALETIQPSLPVPTDSDPLGSFDAYWAGQKAMLATVEAADVPVWTPVAAPSGYTNVQCWDIQARCFAPTTPEKRQMSGYLAKPVGAAAGRLPAIVLLHGAGVASSRLDVAAAWANDGFLALDFNALGVPNGQPSSYYSMLFAAPIDTNGLAGNGLDDYMFYGSNSLSDSFFRELFTRLMRAMDLLTAQPEWDGRILVANGRSQGGAQALAAAGLDQHITFIAAQIPGLCDTSGSEATFGDPPVSSPRISGWPKLVPVDASGHSTDATVLQVSRYFDAVNFAQRTRTNLGSFLSVGFIDPTCPPTGIYAAYNKLSNTKQMRQNFFLGHYPTAGADAAVREAILAHVAAMRAGIPPTPTNLTASVVSSNQINLSWTASVGATSYRVKRAAAIGGPYMAVATGLTTTNYPDIGLAASTTYHYVVSADNADGESAESAPASATTLASGPPAAPVGLTATPGNAQITLNWIASGGATSYNLKRATLSGGSYAPIATGVTGTGYVNTGLTNGITYYYVISSVNNVAESAESLPASAKPTTGTNATVTFTSVAAHDGWIQESGAGTGLGGTVDSATSSSTGLRAGDNSQNRQYKSFVSFETSTLPAGATMLSATLKCKRGNLIGTNPFTTHAPCYADIKGGTGFSGSTNLESSDFQASADATQVATLSNPTNNNDWSTGSLNAAGLSFINPTGCTQFRVYFSLASDGNAVNDYVGWYSGDNATAANWPVLELAYNLCPPAAPAGLSAAPGDARVFLNWPASSGATSYNVKRATVSAGPYTLTASATAPTFTDTAVINGTICYYVVSALNAAGESTDSWEAGARPVALTPPLLASALNGDRFELSWPQGHTGWRLQAQTNSLGTNWADVPASMSTNKITIPISTTDGCVFFRLIYP